MDSSPRWLEFDENAVFLDYFEVLWKMAMGTPGTAGTLDLMLLFRYGLMVLPVANRINYYSSIANGAEREALRFIVGLFCFWEIVIL
ncbi:MAG: hypothetical protein WCI97_03635 [Bacteroidota bacterium]